MLYQFKDHSANHLTLKLTIPLKKQFTKDVRIMFL